jgi:SAM-dependent methyltransferase
MSGAAVSGIDTSEARLRAARTRAAEAGVSLQLRIGDFNEPLPFDDGWFDAVTNRLSLMAADDSVSTLQEFRRILKEGGQVATAVWASPAENGWFSAAREAVATVLGPERAAFARAFGRIGSTTEAEAVHRAAGLRDVSASVLQGEVVVDSAAEHWTRLATDIGHFGRLDGSISAAQRDAIVDELTAKLEPYRSGEILRIPRALVLVRARR